MENRLRRAAERQGMRLVKTRRLDPRAVDYGTYRLASADGVTREELDLAGVAEWLFGDLRERFAAHADAREALR